MGFGISSSGVRLRKYLFIDGAFLDHVLTDISKEFFNSETIEIDFKKISRSYDKVFYYHALPGRKSEESIGDYEARISEKEEYFNKLKLIPMFHVYEGVTYGKAGRIRQKAVDVKIAVDMLKHTINNNMDLASLVAGDMDFRPLLDSLVSEGMTTTLIYYHPKTSNELLYSADIAQPITIIDTIRNWVTDAFREKFAIPNKVDSEFKSEGIEEIQKLKFPNNEGALYKSNEGNYIAELERRGTSRWLTISYHDKDWLLKLLKHDQGLQE